MPRCYVMSQSGRVECRARLLPQFIDFFPVGTRPRCPTIILSCCRLRRRYSLSLPEHYSTKGWIVPRLAVKGGSFNVQIHSAASTTQKSSSTPCNSWIDQRSIRSALLLPGIIICASCRSSRYVESNIVYELKQNLKTSYGS